MSDYGSGMFEPQNIGKDTVPKESISGDKMLLSTFGPKKPASQGSNAFQKISQQNKCGPPTDPKKRSQVRVDELQRTRTDELLRVRTDDLKEEIDHQSYQREQIVENPPISKFADPEEYVQQISKKIPLNEEKKRRKNFFRNLNKLVLFTYEAEEGTDMLESGQNPFLEEVDWMLEEIDSEIESFPKEVDRLLKEINDGIEPLPAEVDRLLQEIDGGTKPLLEKNYEDLKRLNQLREQNESTDSSDPSL